MEKVNNLVIIKELMSFYNLTQTEFAAKIGVHQANLSEMMRGKRACGNGIMAKIRIAFPDVNTIWLDTGKGEIEKPQPSVTQNNYNGNNNYVVSNSGSVGTCEKCGAAVPAVECEEVQAAPIIPASLTRQPDIDVVEEMERRQGMVEISSIRTSDVPVWSWFRVADDSLAPEYKVGDKLALWPYPQGKEKPIPGKMYVVNTSSNGLVARILFPENGDYRAHAVNSEKYPDFVIERDDVVRIFKIMLAVRM